MAEHRKALEDLEESRTLLHSIIDGTSDSIYVKDLKGRYLLFNSAAERITGKKSEEVLGRDDYFLFPPEEAATVMNDDRKVITGRIPVTYEETITTASTITTFLSTKGPVLDKSGNPYGLFGIARDITEQKKIEEEIRKSNEIREQLIR